MTTTEQESNGATRVACLLGVPLAENVVRHGPRWGEILRGRQRVTDYWGEPTVTPGWRQPMTDRLDMPGDGIWPNNEHLGHY